MHQAFVNNIAEILFAVLIVSHKRLYIPLTRVMASTLMEKKCCDQQMGLSLESHI